MGSSFGILTREYPNRYIQFPFSSEGDDNWLIGYKVFLCGDTENRVHVIDFDEYAMNSRTGSLVLFKKLPNRSEVESEVLEFEKDYTDNPHKYA